MQYKHTPIMCNEIITYLNIKPNDIIVDTTAGGGGHLKLIAQKLNNNGKIIALDKDIEAHHEHAAGGVLKHFKYKNIKLIHSSFSLLPKILKQYKINKINALLCDLGMSSHQLNNQIRGFSFLKDGPIDMRMNKQSNITAYDIIQHTSEKQLKHIIYKYGQEEKAAFIAKHIKQMLPIKNSTIYLANIINTLIGKKYNKIHPATKTFQALRIATNNEIKELKQLLYDFPNLLDINGKAIFISFHSLEDKEIKNTLYKLSQQHANGIKKFTLLNKKSLHCNKLELKNNHNARSAKLRVIKKILH